MLRALEIEEEDEEPVFTKYTSRSTPLASYNRTSKEITFYPLVAEDPWRAVSIANYIFLSAFSLHFFIPRTKEATDMLYLTALVLGLPWLRLAGTAGAR
jgi:hypothetical protein